MNASTPAKLATRLLTLDPTGSRVGTLLPPCLLPPAFSGRAFCGLRESFQDWVSVGEFGILKYWNTEYRRGERPLY